MQVLDIMAEREFPPRMFTTGYEPQPDKSIHYFSGKRDLMDALKEALDDDEWEELRNSAFGVFVKWHELNFVWCSRMVHYMLTMQLEVDQKHELWCLLGLQPVRFSLHEFQQITGLNCDYVENLEYPEVEYTADMRAMWELLGLDFEVGPSYFQLLDACNRCRGWERQDRIWLGYLAIYTSFIEAQHWSVSARADMTKLLLSPGALEAYPWGRLAFKILVDSVKTEANKKLQDDKNYQVEGFAEVLNVWVYWACPGIATLYGMHLQDNPAPPLLAYKGSRNRKKVDLELRKQVFY